MSLTDPNEQFVWSEQYQRYYRAQLNPTTGALNFRYWLQPEWSPASASSSTLLSIELRSPGGPYNAHNYDHYQTAQSDCQSRGIDPAYNSPSYRQITTGSQVIPYINNTAQVYGQGAALSDYYYSPGTSHHEEDDQRYYVRARSFFVEGKVFAVVFSETAGANATQPDTTVTESRFRNNYVYTSVRRFVVVRQKTEFCYACPIFTYSNRGTTKPGVRAEEHGIIYSVGQTAQLLEGELGIMKLPICVTMTEGEPTLHLSSRVYYGLHTPIQYNVRVKDIGQVLPSHVYVLIENWREEDGFGQGSRYFSRISRRIDAQPMHEDTGNSDDNVDCTPISDEDEDEGTVAERMDLSSTNTISGPLSSTYEFVSNPKAFFKKGRVFMTLWAEPEGFSDKAYMKIVRFVVVTKKSGHSVCLRISTYDKQATTKAGLNPDDHAAVVPQGTPSGKYTQHWKGETLAKLPLEVKVENSGVTIDAMSRINFAKPYTVEHNIKVQNVGRVVGESVKRLTEYFAESMGHTLNNASYSSNVITHSNRGWG